MKDRMKKHPVAVSGTQKGATPAQLKTLTIMLRDRASMLHHGGCIGVDREADAIAAALSISRIVHPGDNPAKQVPCPGATYLLPKPNLDRNTDIARSTEELILVPKERTEQLRSGTWSTYRRARKAGKSITIIYPDGSTE